MKKILFFNSLLLLISCNIQTDSPNKNTIAVDSNDVVSNMRNVQLDTVLQYYATNLDKYARAVTIIHSNKVEIMKEYFKIHPKGEHKNTIYNVIVDTILAKKLTKNNSKEFGFLHQMFENKLIEPVYSIEFWEKQRNSIVFSVKDDSPGYIYSIIYDPDSTYSQLPPFKQTWLNPKWKIFGYKPVPEN
jgi:putative heme iron utilization protein